VSADDPLSAVLGVELLVAPIAAVVSAGLTRTIRPLLLKHVLAKPNARSSHRIPTPQGAGIAVILATFASTWLFNSDPADLYSNLPLEVFAASLFIAGVGFADDLKPIPILPRLFFQALAISAVLAALPAEAKIIPALPFWLERGLLLLAGLWFVNLVNFMDGLDWMTVAEVVPVTAALAMLGLHGGVILPATAVAAAALCGALIGFAPFNHPVASIFLGDVGSLPIGLLLGWFLLQVAAFGHWAAALLLPLYYLADATVTLLWRMARGEPFWIAHRSHFYQRATDNGFSVLEVVGTVSVLNLALGALAFASVSMESVAGDITCLAVGAVAVAFSMYRFSQKRARGAAGR
jgi:UDP-N-acetylmuramyl pentapeptide phosphotransferase/UDP-N-acetylglucosamine-1-phosphate transferase